MRLDLPAVQLDDQPRMNWIVPRFCTLLKSTLFAAHPAIRWTKWNICEVSHGEILGMAILTRHNCLTLRTTLLIDGLEQPYHRYFSWLKETLKFEVTDDRIRIDVQYFPAFNTALSVNNGMPEKLSFVCQTKRLLLLYALVGLVAVGLFLCI